MAIGLTGFASLTPGVCTVSGATVTLVAAGACAIMATQTGDGAYNAAPAVTQGFVVHPGDGAAPNRVYLPLLVR